MARCGCSPYRVYLNLTAIAGCSPGSSSPSGFPPTRVCSTSARAVGCSPAAELGARWVFAVDVSRRAVLAARVNAMLNGVTVNAIRGDLYAPVRGERFDLIVSNPPYVPAPEGELPPRGAARAWEGGADGRSIVDRICAQAYEHPRPGGTLLLMQSSVCSERATVSALTGSGLQTGVVARNRGRLGPLLKARAGWRQQRGLLAAPDSEELLIIRAQRPAEDQQPHVQAGGRVSPAQVA